MPYSRLRQVSKIEQKLKLEYIETKVANTYSPSRPLASKVDADTSYNCRLILEAHSR